MAYNIKKIFPLDVKPSIAIGVGLPFNGDAVFKSTYLTKDAIKFNLINFFLTNKRERYFNNRFGNIKAFIFEQITDNNISNLKEDIQSIINNRFTNIKINSLDIDVNNDFNSFRIKLNYSILNTEITDNLEITF